MADIGRTGPGEKSRDQVIVRTSVIGIIANVFLAAFKAVIGILSNSIAVILDAVNNLSDALSSIITIIGTKLAGRKPDKKHPLGHGRIEFLSALIVAGLVLYAGITALVESVKGILEPEAPEYQTIGLVIIGVAVVVKLFLGIFFRKRGKQVNSGVLVASGTDALFDALISIGVLASAIIFLTTGLSLEAYVGVLISLVIIKAGIEMMMDTLNEILGRRLDRDFLKEIRDTICEEEQVAGAYDLILHNYGPDRNYASVHVELPDTMTVEEVDKLTRKVEAKVYRETGVILTGVGVYSYNTGSGEAAMIRNRVQEAVLRHDWALQLHGFYADPEAKTIRFDVVLSFDIEPGEALAVLSREMQEAYPDYTTQIVPDVDISD